MFTKDDYREYLALVERTEKKMFDLLTGFIENLQDERLKGVLAGIKRDEERHSHMVRELLESLK